MKTVNDAELNYLVQNIVGRLDDKQDIVTISDTAPESGNVWIDTSVEGGGGLDTNAVQYVDGVLQTVGGETISTADETARAAAATAQSTADSAASAAATAQSTADGAVSAAATAQSTADGKQDANNNLVQYANSVLATLGGTSIDLGGAKIATGSYTGTGTYGSSNPCSLTFDFVPSILVICEDQYYLTSIFAKSSDGYRTYCTDSGTTIASGTVYVTWNNNTISWYTTFTGISGVARSGDGYQRNISGKTYRYMAFE